MKIISIEYCTQSPDELIIEIERSYWLFWTKTETFTVKYDKWINKFYYVSTLKYLSDDLNWQLFARTCSTSLY